MYTCIYIRIYIYIVLYIYWVDYICHARSKRMIFKSASLNYWRVEQVNKSGLSHPKLWSWATRLMCKTEWRLHNKTRGLNYQNEGYPQSAKYVDRISRSNLSFRQTNQLWFSEVIQSDGPRVKMNWENLGECVTEGQPSNCKGCDSAFFWMPENSEDLDTQKQSPSTAMCFSMIFQIHTCLRFHVESWGWRLDEFKRVTETAGTLMLNCR